MIVSGNARWLIACLICAGCTEGGLPGLVPVTGTVTLDGEPLAQGTVGFAPVDEKLGQPASGKIKDGKFTMVTSASSPGVVAGEYKVVIMSVEAPEELPADSVIKPGDVSMPSSLIPERYGASATSELEITVESGMAPVVFELNSGE